VPKTDVLGLRALNWSTTLHVKWMDRDSINRDGALPVETRRAGRVPGPLPRYGPRDHEGPPQVTRVHLRPQVHLGGQAPVPVQARIRRRQRGRYPGNSGQHEERPRPLNILQWNAEGIMNKKGLLRNRLIEEDIDIACIQETHLNPNNMFSIRGYQPAFRVDREGRHNRGILILVKNNIPAREVKVDTADPPGSDNRQAEIHGVVVTVGEIDITVFNLYCPDNRDLSLRTMDVPEENCLIVGDFNSRSTTWGYSENNPRGDEVEDWQTECNLILLNDTEDQDTFYSRRWMTTSTPDLAFATGNLAWKTERKVKCQLAGSDHRPIKLEIDLLFKPKDIQTFPRWNYKKADWDEFARLSDDYTGKIKTDVYNPNQPTNSFIAGILKAASESIPRGARKDYKPYWNEELQNLENAVEESRKEAESNPSVENNIALKAATARCRKAYNQAARSSWREKTASLNMDKNGNKLWTLMKSLNGERRKAAPIVVKKGDDFVSGQAAANCFIDNYEEVSNLDVPEERKKQVKDEINVLRQQEDAPEYMNSTLSLQELEKAIGTLKDCKSPGPDKITNEMLKHMGPKAKRVLLEIFNKSWKSGHVPQAWREAHMVPIHKKGKDKSNTGSYRPISLTSCVGKVLERMINSRLMWHLEKNKLLSKYQAGFRQDHSTEDQAAHVAQMIEDSFQDKKHTLAVWVDLEKAFDKVWKDGLRLKLQRCGVRGCMYKWISQFLHNRNARVQMGGSYSRKKILTEGVPQGGVLSPTLFLIFINDVLNDLPRGVHGAMYADDLILWCTEESIGTARYRLQEALNLLERWTKLWLVKINATKTTYSIFTLSTKMQTANLRINGELLKKEDTPTYLGVTYDQRLTWKAQTEQAETRAKLRLNLMRRLAGTTWGADAKILKTVYTGSVRPALEYGMAASCTTAKSHFDRLNRVQNQATRLITGGMRSTPIQALEETTGLQSLEDRRDVKVLTQAAKFKRMPDHPMKERMKGNTKRRLQRSSFLRESRRLEDQSTDLEDKSPKELPRCLATPAWRGSPVPVVRTSIPDVGPKATQDATIRKALTLEHLENNYPPSEWIQAYTDGSADGAIRNGGAGVYIRYPNNREDRYQLPTGAHSTNFKAEIEAIRKAAEVLVDENMPKIVILTDALSVLQSLETEDKNMNELSTALAVLCEGRTVVLQWIPSHCGISGNEEADRLAKAGTLEQQPDDLISSKEQSTIIKSTFKKKWEERHPDFRRNDAYHLLPRREQVIIFRLRTGHNRLRHHLFTKMRIGPTDLCPCGDAPQTAKHILQDCRNLAAQRRQFWPTPIDITQKLYGCQDDLQRTADFISNINLSL
jgi:ribonuclease HI